MSYNYSAHSTTTTKIPNNPYDSYSYHYNYSYDPNTSFEDNNNNHYLSFEDLQEEFPRGYECDFGYEASMPVISQQQTVIETIRQQQQQQTIDNNYYNNTYYYEPCQQLQQLQLGEHQQQYCEQQQSFEQQQQQQQATNKLSSDQEQEQESSSSSSLDMLADSIPLYTSYYQQGNSSAPAPHVAWFECEAEALLYRVDQYLHNLEDASVNYSSQQFSWHITLFQPHALLIFRVQLTASATNSEGRAILGYLEQGQEKSFQEIFTALKQCILLDTSSTSTSDAIDQVKMKEDLCVGNGEKSQAEYFKEHPAIIQEIIQDLLVTPLESSETLYDTVHTLYDLSKDIDMLDLLCSAQAITGLLRLFESSHVEITAEETFLMPYALLTLANFNNSSIALVEMSNHVYFLQYLQSLQMTPEQSTWKLIKQRADILACSLGAVVMQQQQIKQQQQQQQQQNSFLWTNDNLSVVPSFGVVA